MRETFGQPAAAALRPAIVALPAVGAGLVGEHRRRRLGCARFRVAFQSFLQIPVEERLQDVAAEGERGVAVEAERPERATVAVRAAVVPGTEHQEVSIVGRVFGLERGIACEGAVDILLVPETTDVQGRHGEGLAGEQPVDCLLLPVAVVGRVLGEAPPERQLLHAHLAAERARRPRGEEAGVVVVVAGPETEVVLLPRRLLVDIERHSLAERSVVEPVVADPAVDHRVDRYRDLQRRMGIEETHQNQEPRVGGADHADSAVGLRHVLDQPVDGVPGVGRVVDGARVQRPAQGAVHHVFALRAVLAADVLKDADVARERYDVIGRGDYRLQSGSCPRGRWPCRRRRACG